VRTVLVIGIGAGDPEQLTLEAITTLNRADVVFVVDKRDEQDDLAAVRRLICERHITGAYREHHMQDPERGRGAEAVAAWRSARAELFEAAIGGLDDDGTGAFLVWGDPSLYDSTLGVLDEVQARGAVVFDIEVVPGISSVQTLAARHRIALNRVGRPVTFTPGRRLDEVFTPGVLDVVVMLDPDCRFTDYPDVDIYWGAYLGTPDELLVSGRVSEVGDRIVSLRAEARDRKGWMFDTYLLRRSGGSSQT